MRLDNNQQAFLALIRAGLWEKEVRLLSYGDIDFAKVLRLAEEQSVVGLIAAGLEHISDMNPAQNVVLQFVGLTMQLEQHNSSMNSFIGVLVDRVRAEGIEMLLVKGQGIALCYGKPLWRSCGDVDFFLRDDNYHKTVQLLSPIASSVDEENEYKKHIALTIDGWSVELHGTLRSGLWSSLDRALDDVQDTMFYEGKVRSWTNGGTQVLLPHPDEDVVFVFAHILQHFYKEGIGLRQICDWCRLMWTYRDSLNHGLLESRIKKAGVMTEWKSFAALAVDYLGMPVEAMPLYSDGKKWSRKADKVMGFILETGNFGHNRDYTYQKKYPYIIYKAISFWKHLKDGAFFFSIFPLDSIKVTWRRMVVGVSVVLQGKRHE
jgi:hypothetical protein